MKKKIDVILKKDVEKLGLFGEIKKVAAGFARNYLIPKGYALYLKDPRAKAILKEKEKIQQKIAQEIEQLKKLAQRLEEITLALEVRTDEKGKLFGSVKPKEVVEKLAQEYKIKLEAKQLEMEPIKTIEEAPTICEIGVRLGQGIAARLKLQLYPLSQKEISASKEPKKRKQKDNNQKDNNQKETETETKTSPKKK